MSNLAVEERQRNSLIGKDKLLNFDENIEFSSSASEFNIELLVNLKMSEIIQKYKSRTVKADGNCFYRAVSLHFNNDENKHSEVRQLISNFGIMHPELFLNHGKDVQQVKDFFLDQQIDGIWAELEVFEAASELLNTIIIIWSDLTDEESVFIPSKCDFTKDHEITGLILKENHFILLIIPEKFKINAETGKKIITQIKINTKLTYLSRKNKNHQSLYDIYTYLKTKYSENPKIPNKILAGN